MFYRVLIAFTTSPFTLIYDQNPKQPNTTIIHHTQLENNENMLKKKENTWPAKKYKSY